MNIWQKTKKTRMKSHPCFLNLTKSILYEKTLFCLTSRTKISQKRVNTSQAKLKNVKP